MGEAIHWAPPIVGWIFFAAIAWLVVWVVWVTVIALSARPPDDDDDPPTGEQG